MHEFVVGLVCVKEKEVSTNTNREYIKQPTRTLCFSIVAFNFGDIVC